MVFGFRPGPCFAMHHVICNANRAFAHSFGRASDTVANEHNYRGMSVVGLETFRRLRIDLIVILFLGMGGIRRKLFNCLKSAVGNYQMQY